MQTTAVELVIDDTNYHPVFSSVMDQIVTNSLIIVTYRLSWKLRYLKD